MHDVRAERIDEPHEREQLKARSLAIGKRENISVRRAGLHHLRVETTNSAETTFEGSGVKMVDDAERREFRAAEPEIAEEMQNSQTLGHAMMLGNTRIGRPQDSLWAVRAFGRWHYFGFHLR